MGGGAIGVMMTGRRTLRAAFVMVMVRRSTTCARLFTVTVTARGESPDANALLSAVLARSFMAVHSRLFSQ